MDDITLRRARPEDGPALSSLAYRSKASNGYDEAFMAQCRAELTVVPDDTPGRSTWIAEDRAGRALGFFDLIVENGSAEVEGLFVEPGNQRSGLGRRLWIKLEAEAIAQGAVDVSADADPKAVPFYCAMGLAPIGTRPSGSIPGRRLPRLRKAFRP